jgi:ribosome biogenesis GTPase
MTLSLPSLGWDEDFDAAYRGHHRRDRWPARVSRAEPGVCQVLAADGAGRASLAGSLLAAAAGDPMALPCAGDWVVVQAWPDGRATIDAVLRRRNVLHLSCSGSRLARLANIDRVAVVAPAGSLSDAATPACLHTIGVAGPPPEVVVLGDDAQLAELRSYAAAGRTVGVLQTLVGRSFSAVFSVLGGATPLSGGALLPLPGGGAVVTVDLTATTAAVPLGSVAAPLGPAAVAGRGRSRPVTRRRA